jgi:hypothetical protein
VKRYADATRRHLQDGMFLFGNCEHKSLCMLTDVTYRIATHRSILRCRVR